ncbi:MAG: lasso peptide biosynthesis B2 protein [Desulfobulbaceae bacterium]|jgi:hypothetical protein|nr:lasso peptide biosynthesis B2 protein [Desulfobulbaceae bacterium]
MLTRISKFLSLSRREKQLFLQAFILLGLMRVAILTIPFKWLTRSLDHAQNQRNLVILMSQEVEMASLVSLSINRAAKYTPWKSACLAQALTAQYMLRKRHIPGLFFLGLRKNKDVEQKMDAHAWSKCGDLMITGGKGHEGFTVISVFEWGRG